MVNAGVLATAVLMFSACAEKPGSVPEVPAEELNASVPELSAVHEFMQPLWHDAFPSQDFEMIQELVPQFEPTLATLDAVELPGILQDKQEDWDQGKVALRAAYEGLQGAAEAGNEEEMLGYSETFHMAYEGLVRLIRPPAPEVDAFHQHLYGLYHYYGPGYDLEKIRAATEGMVAAIPPLQSLELPERFADHGPEYQSAVTGLSEAVDGLVAQLEDPRRDDVQAAINRIHDAYAEIEGIFAGESHE
jgi:hypothetical protein